MSVKGQVKGTYKKTPVGSLPADWECLPFSEVFTRVTSSVDVKPDATYREIGIRSHGKGVFLKEEVKGTVIGEKRVFRCQPGTLCFNIVFAWEQAVAILGPECQGYIASHRFPMYKAISSANEEFYLWFFKSRRGKHGLTLASPGGAGRNKTLGQGELDFLNVPVPPLHEQDRIAQVLATWDQAIDKTMRLIATKQRYKAGLIHQFLSEFRIAAKGHSSSHRLMEFRDIASLCKDKFDPRKDAADCRCIELEHISQGDGRLLGWAKSGDLGSLKNRFTPGDVLFGKLRPYLRKSFLANFMGVCSTEIWVLRPNVAVCRPDYLFHVTQSGSFLRAANVTAGSKMPRADWDLVAGHLVPVPSLVEQARIAGYLSARDKEIALLHCHLDAIKMQKKGLMQQLLTGRVRVSCHKGRA
jgi:type I restriction enzyme S subunit